MWDVGWRRLQLIGFRYSVSSVSSNANAHRSLGPEHDAYTDLLRDTRGLRREQSQAREAWFSLLPGEMKEDLLFELEITLKGLACFANPRNHPGPPRRTPVVAQDYREQLVMAREAVTRIVQLCRQLLHERERSFVFQRYLETVLPDDSARTRLVSEAMTQDTPEESLFVLRHAMTNLLEVASGVARLPRVPFRLFYSLLGVAQREVSQSTYFNPLSALEFRPEFDRITNPQVLELMRSVPSEQARRLVALTFLSLFRMLRYLTLLESLASRPPDGTRRIVGSAYLVFSVLRSDARALTGYLRKRAGPLLAESYERDVFRVPSTHILQRYDGLLAEGHRLLAIKATFEGVSANVRLEMRRVFDHDIPAPALAPSAEQVRVAIRAVALNLRPSLQNLVLFLGKALGVRLDEQGVFDDKAARRLLSERLRRDVWMFAQIVRAFAQKARTVQAGEDRWGGVSPLQFVREFLTYFKAMGYPLLRASEYPRFDSFLGAMSQLEESDLYDTARLSHAMVECEKFQEFLTGLFTQLGNREELAESPFDRKGAAESLRLYLGD
jgi:hypothetical protein